MKGIDVVCFTVVRHSGCLRGLDVRRLVVLAIPETGCISVRFAVLQEIDDGKLVVCPRPGNNEPKLLCR